MLPPAPGRAESHGFDYKRNGTLSLFAALNTATGEVVVLKTMRQTDFIASGVLASQHACRSCANYTSCRTVVRDA